MLDHAMGATTNSAAAGVETLSPGDSSSPSSGGPDRLTPESSSSEDLCKEAHGLAMDPLLSSDDDDDDSSDGDEVYELREQGSRAVDGRLRNGFSYTAEEERVVVEKFDRRLVLFVAFLYMLSFLDRSSSSHFSFHVLLIIFLYTVPGTCVQPPKESAYSQWGVILHPISCWGQKV